MMSAVFGAGAGVKLDPYPLLIGLLKGMLIPLAFGLAVRAYIPGAANYVDSRRRQFSLLSSLLLVSVSLFTMYRIISSSFGHM